MLFFHAILSRSVSFSIEDHRTILFISWTRDLMDSP